MSATLEVIMHKATLGIIAVLALWGATSWQPPQPVPQWKVILEQHEFVGTHGLFDVPLFTPTSHKVYRSSATCSAIDGEKGSGWTFSFFWTDLSGTQVVRMVSCENGPNNQEDLSSVAVFAPQAGIPVTLSNAPFGGGSHWSAVYVIEELQ